MDTSRFADADATLDEADVAVLGAPYEATVSFKGGTREGPAALREASWNFETFHLRNGADLALAQVHDAGDVAVQDLAPGKMREAVRADVSRLLDADAMPMLMGGEHAVSVGAIDAVHAAHPDLVVVALDAHLDYRAEYEGEALNHACVARRAAETLGDPRRVAWVGVRSASSEEWHDARRDGVNIATAFHVKQHGMGPALSRVLDQVPRDAPVYLTIDIDGLDPAYAPGTGTPEPFGLTPWDMLNVITRLGPRIVGFDVVEVAPFDNGISANAGARLMRELIAERLLREAATS